MAQADNAAALREWLRDCPEIGRERPFGADYLGDGAGCCALSVAPREVKYRVNILGDTVPLPRQSREFLFAARLPYGADAAGNLENLAWMRAVADWIAAQNAARRFPEWTGGRVAGIVPTLMPAPADTGGDTARYQIGIRVDVEPDN